MNTCKATLRVLAAHKLYIIIYLVLIGVMMLAINGSSLLGGDGSGVVAVYDPGGAKVAVVDRDSDRGGVASSLRAYLAADNEMVDLADDSQALQQAVASNWVDLIVIVPDGYADELLDSAASGGGVSAVDTVTSYTSGAGSMASMAVGGFLSMTRTELVGANVTGVSSDTGAMSATARPSLDDLTAATQRVKTIARDKDANHAIAVDHADAEAGSAHAAAASAADRTVAGFGSTIKSALYPLFLALAVVAVYLLASVALILAGGHDPSNIPASGVAMTIASACVYALMTVACGFLLGEAGVGDTMANGFANVVGLLLLFTSGIALPLDMMPEPMLTVGRMLPGWWYCTAIDDALGAGTAASGGVDVAGWAVATGIVALYAVALVSLGLAVGRIRRARPAPVAAATTRLAEA